MKIILRFHLHCNTLTNIHHTWVHLKVYKAQTSLAPLPWFHGSRVTTAHVHQCCIFQSNAKTVPSRMKLTMREPASMATDTWSRRVTSDFNSVFKHKKSNWKSLVKSFTNILQITDWTDWPSDNSEKLPAFQRCLLCIEFLPCPHRIEEAQPRPLWVLLTGCPPDCH